MHMQIAISSYDILQAALKLYQRRLGSGSAAMPTRKHCRKALDELRAKIDLSKGPTSEHPTLPQIQPRLPPVDATSLYSQIVRVFSSGSSLFDFQSRPDVVMQVFWDCLEQGQVPADNIWASLNSDAEQKVRKRETMMSITLPPQCVCLFLVRWMLFRLRRAHPYTPNLQL